MKTIPSNIDSLVRADSPLNHILVRWRTGAGKTYAMIRLLLHN